VSLHVCVLGIDGSGKSTIVAALPAVLAAETGFVVGSAGESFSVAGPDQDHLAHRFYPDGLPVAARLSLKLKRLAKRLVDHPKLYAVFKLAQMLLQDSAAKALVQRYRTNAFVSDGNAFLSATGRAGNYLRAASSEKDSDVSAPDAQDLQAVFSYVLDEKPVPAPSSEKLPSLRKAKLIYKLNRLLRLNAAWLPDIVIFLDLSPELALNRIRSRGKKIDKHENLADLTQAREMYLKTLQAFKSYRTEASVHTIKVDELSPGEILKSAIDAVREHLTHSDSREQTSDTPLGTTELKDETIRKKTVDYRYLFRYLLPKWFRGAWREPTFFFSKLGRLFLKEGYSAGVMRAIYDRDEIRYGLLDRIFLEYSLHRAVYDRLQILVRKIEPEIEARLARGNELHIFTAPSGFAYDLFRPLEAIALRDPDVMKRVHITAADLDPHHILQQELNARAERLGVHFTFHRGDITDPAMLSHIEASSPFDLALFVGLSSWLPKPPTLNHLAWLRKNLRADGLLITDCFTPEAYALSGRYIGYKATYYSPDVYKAMLDYCGFDGLSADVESGRDHINHVLVAGPKVVEEGSTTNAWHSRHSINVPALQSSSN
jgi:energy-coupling factor transporter ATP-binding protein EcfA2